MRPVTKRRLPIGIQTFREIREEGYYYVDKTAYARRLAGDAGKHYFLSRPRRFGKSLFVDTLKELFEGAEPLFRGLAVHDDWDWSKRHPVVRLSFGGGNFKQRGFLEETAAAQIDDVAARAGVGAGGPASAPVRLRRLIEALSARAGARVAVLVDEYDKPILDALDEPRTARANRDGLRGLYSTIKDCDAWIEFTFITGATRSPATKAAGRACSTPSSPRPGWTSSSRTAAAAAGWTWWCGTAARCTCSNSRWSSRRRGARRWRSCGRGTTPESTARRAGRCA